MPQARKYKSNAERQAAYRARKAEKVRAVTAETRGTRALVDRVMASDRAAGG